MNVSNDDHDQGDTQSASPCVVSDKVVYRTLLRGAERLVETVLRALRRGRTSGAPLRRRVFDLAVRIARLESDPRTSCALVGVDALAWSKLRQRLETQINPTTLQSVLVMELRRIVRQYSQDVRLATDEELFGAGGLALRDEIEFVRMFIEHHCPEPIPSVILRELERADGVAQPRLKRYLTGIGCLTGVGPADGFDLPPGIVPQRFWWRQSSISEGQSD